MSLPLLNIYEDFGPDYFLERKDPSTGIWIPSNGLTTLQMRIALTRTGTTIGTSIATLSERGQTGLYNNPIPTATLVADLAGYLWQTVYVILSKAGDLDMRWDAFMVSDNAPVDP